MASFINWYQSRNTDQLEIVAITPPAISEGLSSWRKSSPGEGSTLWLLFMIGTFTLLISIFALSNRQTTSSTSKGLGGYMLSHDREGILREIWLEDRRGIKIRKIWQAPIPWSAKRAWEMERLSLSRMIAVAPNPNQGFLVVDIFNDSLNLHHSESTESIPLPDLSVTTMGGLQISDIDHIQTIKWLETPSFQGFAILVVSKNLFVGCLLLLQRDFKEAGRLYNPGRIIDIVQDDDQLFLSAYLNARQERFSAYRPALARISITEILGKTVQFNPFSRKTLSPKKIEEYQLAQTPIINPDHYLVFPPRENFRPSLEKSRKTLLFSFSQIPSKKITIQFSQDLVYLNRTIQEHVFNLDYESECRATQFRYWEKDHWSPLQATDCSLP